MLGLQALSSIYLGAITALALAVATGLALAGRPRRAATLARLARGRRARAVLVAAPVARPYLRMRAFQGVEWTIDDVATYATTLSRTRPPARGSTAASPSATSIPARVQDTLFPGVVAARARHRRPGRARRAATARSRSRPRRAAIVISLGPETAVYRFLHEHVVLVRGVRALSRFSLVPVLALSRAGRPRAGGPPPAGAAWRSPLFLRRVDERAASATRWRPGPSEAARWLRGRQRAPSSHLPLGERDTQAMLDGVAHWRPLRERRLRVRAASVHARDGAARRPAVGGRAALPARGRRDAASSAREALALPEIGVYGPDRVYTIDPGPRAEVVRGERARATLWRPEGALLDLGAPTAVDRVVFAVGDGPWLDAPSVRVSEDGRTWNAVPATASLADATLSLYQDPRAGRGAVRFPTVTARYLWLDPRLPARQGPLETRP